MSAMCWLASRGANVAIPVGSSPHWDLVAELEGRVLRIQVKTSVCVNKGRWAVTLCTRGGNQSWSVTAGAGSSPRIEWRAAGGFSSEDRNTRTSK